MTREPREGSLYSSDVDQSVLMSPPSMVKSAPVMLVARGQRPLSAVTLISQPGALGAPVVVLCGLIQVACVNPAASVGARPISRPTGR